jgi:Flp pilus assembly protein TadG
MNMPVKMRSRGTATVEFALVSPLLMLLLAGVLDFGVLLRTATCAANAARAGIEYGSRSASASVDYAGMQNAAVNSMPGVTGLTAAAVRSCQCSGGSAVSCTGSCANGKMMIYVKVTASARAHTVFNYSRLPYSNLASSTAWMRVQ